MAQKFTIQDFQGIDVGEGKWNLRELPLDKITPNPDQPRKDMGDIDAAGRYKEMLEDYYKRNK